MKLKEPRQVEEVYNSILTIFLKTLETTIQN